MQYRSKLILVLTVKSIICFCKIFFTKDKNTLKMFTIEQLPLEFYQEDPGWNSSSPVTYILRKIHTYTSLLCEMSNWSLSETAIPNLSKPPSLLLLWGVFFVANSNMCKLECLLLTGKLSPGDQFVFETKFEAGSQHFEDLTHLLIQIEHETAIENNANPWYDSLDFNNFQKMVLENMRGNAKLKNLVERVHEFNESIETLENFLKDREEFSKKEEQQGKDDKGGEEGKHKEKDIFNNNNAYLFKGDDKLDNKNDNLESGNLENHNKLDKDNEILKNENNQLNNEKSNLHNDPKNRLNKAFEWLDTFLEKQWNSLKIE